MSALILLTFRRFPVASSCLKLPPAGYTLVTRARGAHAATDRNPRHAGDTTTTRKEARFHLVQRGPRLRLPPAGDRRAVWVVQVRYQHKVLRITLGPVGTLPFEGPPDHPGAVDLARIALNAATARRGPARRHRSRQASARRHPRRNLGSLRRRRASAAQQGGRHQARLVDQDRDVPLEQAFRDRIAHEPPADFDDVRTQRWLDTITGVGATRHA